MKEIKEALHNICSKTNGKVAFNISMARLSTIRIGGEALALLEPGSVDALSEMRDLLEKKGIENIVIGAGSNILFPDGRIDTAIIKLSSGTFANISVDGQVVQVGAGVRLSRLISECANHGLSGVEGLVGIPGTVGGAVIRNASNKVSIGDVLTKVQMLSPDGKISWVDVAEMDFSYRRSNAADMGIVLGAEFSLAGDSPEEIRNRTMDFMSLKMSRQPLDKKTLGCIFKNPGSGELSCGKLIATAGLKGLKVGGAVISSKHANFIVNEDGALAQDVTNIIDEVKTTIYDKFSIKLEPEIKIVC